MPRTAAVNATIRRRSLSLSLSTKLQMFAMSVLKSVGSELKLGFQLNWTIALFFLILIVGLFPVR